MRTVDYSDVLEDSLALAGIPLTDDFDYTDGTFALMRSYHDGRLQVAWEIHAWPDICRYEKRSFRARYNSNTVYAAGAEVLDIPTLRYFQALQTTVGRAPTTAGVVNDQYWALCASAYGGSDFDADAIYSIGTQVRNPADNQFYQFLGATSFIVSGAGVSAANGTYAIFGAGVDGRPTYTNGTCVIQWRTAENLWFLYSGGTVYYAAIGDYLTPELGDWFSADNTFAADPANDPPPAIVAVAPAITATASWGLLTPFQRYVAFQQYDAAGAALTPLAEVFKAWDKDPRVTTKTGRLNFQVTSDGFAFTTLHHATAYVWLFYRQQRPTLTGGLFDATRVYTSGRQVYYRNATTGVGNFYNCQATTTAGESPETTPTKWSQVELPYIFRAYLAQGGYADWLTGDGQGDKSAAVERNCVGLLELEADKLHRQQQQANRLEWR